MVVTGTTSPWPPGFAGHGHGDGEIGLALGSSLLKFLHDKNDRRIGDIGLRHFFLLISRYLDPASLLRLEGREIAAEAIGVLVAALQQPFSGALEKAAGESELIAAGEREPHLRHVSGFSRLKRGNAIDSVVLAAGSKFCAEREPGLLSPGGNIPACLFLAYRPAKTAATVRAKTIQMSASVFISSPKPAPTILI